MAAEGVRHEREALRYFSIKGKFSSSNFIEVCTKLQCGACGGQVVDLGEGLEVCEDFECQNKLEIPSGKIYTVKAEIVDEAGSFTEVEVSSKFMTNMCGEPEDWEAVRRGVKVVAARLFCQVFSEITVAVLLPVAKADVKMMRAVELMVVTAK